MWEKIHHAMPLEVVQNLPIDSNPQALKIMEGQGRALLIGEGHPTSQLAEEEKCHVILLRHEVDQWIDHSRAEVVPEICPRAYKEMKERDPTDPAPNPEIQTNLGEAAQDLLTRDPNPPVHCWEELTLAQAVVGHRELHRHVHDQMSSPRNHRYLTIHLVHEVRVPPQCLPLEQSQTPLPSLQIGVAGTVRRYQQLGEVLTFILYLEGLPLVRGSTPPLGSLLHAQSRMLLRIDDLLTLVEIIQQHRELLETLHFEKMTNDICLLQQLPPPVLYEDLLPEQGPTTFLKPRREEGQMLRLVVPLRVSLTNGKSSRT